MNKSRPKPEDSWLDSRGVDSAQETVDIHESNGTSEIDGHDFGMLPQTFGRYIVTESIGEGGMGTVYLAEDTQLKRKVAIKIPKFRSSVGRLAERFQREARAAATLNHPNICPIFDAGEIERVNYLAMGYVQGRPLSEFIRGGRLPSPRTVALIIRKVALAIQEAHSHRLVHRDIKPANIMIDHRNEPIVMDFGLACQPDDASSAGDIEVSGEGHDARLTQDGSLLGSPAYMAPEQLHGKSMKIGPQCDIYSLGVVMYELLTGGLPFPGSGSVMSTIQDVLSKDTPLVRDARTDVDPQLSGICSKAMAKPLDERYASMAEFAADLTSYLKSTPSHSGNDPALGAARPVSESAELIRAREHYELAQSLCKTGQFAAAAAILERMREIQDPSAKQLVEWARQELPKAQARADQQTNQVATTTALDSIDERLVHEERLAPMAGGGATLGSPLFPSKKQPASWIPWLIAAAIGALVFMILLILVGVISRALSEDEPSDPEASSSGTPAAAPEPAISPPVRGGVNALERAKKRLAELDKNQDGKLAPAELPPLWRPLLQRHDADKDGKLDLVEVKALLRKQPHPPSGPRVHP